MNSKEKLICVHGHFYQPPRENAWLGIIEQQESAAPFHDWNERIAYECYAPNATARILGQGEKITKIVNNYENISFNFGPTLLSWIKAIQPGTYHKIIEADRKSREKHNGHGNAIAQVYNHIIMPLAGEKDKQTQVKWGIEDFRFHFGREPEGMWLAETAVDMATLEALADNNIKFTILAPGQAKAIRKTGNDEWIQKPDGSIDTTRAYQCRLPSGKSIVLFFYNGAISHDIAFNGLLNDGKQLAARLLQPFEKQEAENFLVHVATDGETYGHHHRFGEMALADAINHIEKNKLGRFINYGYFLEKFPPEWEVLIHENTSWSCAHGIERWRSDCGCRTGGEAGWHQKWRGPLRVALDWLKNELDFIFENEGTKLLQEPWHARNEYCKVLLDRNEKTVSDFEKHKITSDYTSADRTQLFRLMEMQKHGLLMYSSCGWFFNDISGIETLQILQYAHRAMQYAEQVSGRMLVSEFAERLKKAPGNAYADGKEVFEKLVMTSYPSLENVGIQYAAFSLFEENPEQHQLFNYIIKNEALHRERAGNQKLVAGRAVIESRVTFSLQEFCFIAVHLGQHHIMGEISMDMDKETFERLSVLAVNYFQQGYITEILSLLQEHFPGDTFTLQQLFKDNKQRILDKVLSKSLEAAEANFREIYNDNYQLMSDFQKNNIPIPEAFRSAVSFVVHQNLYNFFKEKPVNTDYLQQLIHEIKKWKLSFSDGPRLQLMAGESLSIELEELKNENAAMQEVEKIIMVFTLLKEIDLVRELWKSQNIYYHILLEFKEGRRIYPDNNWEEAFYQLGNLLNIEAETEEAPK